MATRDRVREAVGQVEAAVASLAAAARSQDELARTAAVDQAEALLRDLRALAAELEEAAGET